MKWPATSALLATFLGCTPSSDSDSGGHDDTGVAGTCDPESQTFAGEDVSLEFHTPGMGNWGLAMFFYPGRLTLYVELDDAWNEGDVQEATLAADQTSLLGFMLDSGGGLRECGYSGTDGTIGVTGALRHEGDRFVGELTFTPSMLTFEGGVYLDKVELTAEFDEIPPE